MTTSSKHESPDSNQANPSGHIARYPANRCIPRSHTLYLSSLQNGFHAADCTAVAKSPLLKLSVKSMASTRNILVEVLVPQTVKLITFPLRIWAT